MKLSEIVYDVGQYWIFDDKKNRRYTVFKSGITVSESDSSYARTDDGLSIAKARVDYLNNRDVSN
jgi:hypothetical protein